MNNDQRTYISIDLKSFYASVECVLRGLDPLTTNLVVADKSRTEKTICLAVSPSLKAYGVSGRARLFEVVQRVGEVNRERLLKAPGHKFAGATSNDIDVRTHPEFELDYIVATPQMAHYMEVSSKIFSIYMNYIAPEDIHVYSVDEVFMDVTSYLKIYNMTPHELAMTMIHDVLKQTGITATAGIGTNMYLCKVAMDIVAKHIPADGDGVRIAELDEMSYREKLWEHTPLTDFWRVGGGYARKLANIGLFTMGDVAEYSLDEGGRDHLFKLFGINAELLIDHAWGYEPCRIEDIKTYGAKTKSLGQGQVLQEPYPYEKAKLVTKEMAEALSLDLASKGLMTDQIVLTIGYDRENLDDPERRAAYKGRAGLDHYGRLIPEHSHGTYNLNRISSSTILIREAAEKLFTRIAEESLTVRRITIAAGKVYTEADLERMKAEEEKQTGGFKQLSFFGEDSGGIYGTSKANGTEIINDGGTAPAASHEDQSSDKLDELIEKEKRRQKAVMDIQKKYGKNAVVKGMNMLDGATMIDRNGQIGGHKA